MIQIENIVREQVLAITESLYGSKLAAELVQIQKTRKEFEGDFTLVVFPFVKISRKSPEATAQELGVALQQAIPQINAFNVVKGFLNLAFKSDMWIQCFNQICENVAFGHVTATQSSPMVMIEYSSPNTNKPLHLGHIRNNLLGFSLAEVLKANGNRVVKTNIVNDRGIHICKSMLAWQKWGNGETPQSSGKKGDHLVGEYYVMFDKAYKAEIAQLVENGMSQEDAEKNAPLLNEARQLLLKWEEGDVDVLTLWRTMNTWVYAGFDATYKALGVDFDKIYYESETYTVGRDEVLRGVDEKVFEKMDDGSVWSDLTADGLDRKLLLRKDGTSVYMTQDIGTAKLRFDDFKIDKMVYVVGNEQNYHFQVLALLLDKLGYEWGKGLTHFSYGMVELPHGKMKSREGTVVDADDLMADMIKNAREVAAEAGKLGGLSEQDSAEIFETVALGALKYYMLKVDPKKTMMFNPQESIDFNGNTGPFIQYTYARIQSILRKASDQNIVVENTIDASLAISQKEIEVIKKISEYRATVSEAAEAYSPAIVANYVYELVKEFNQFYHDYTVLGEENPEMRNFRLQLANQTAQIIKKGMSLLGAKVPERM